MKINHQFVSAKGDGPDSTLVKPTAWNADHVMVTAADAVVLGRLAGAGPGAVQEIPISNPFTSLTLYNEVVLSAANPEMRVTVPPGAKYIELHFFTSNQGNVNDTLKLNGLNGAAILNLTPHQTQFLYGLGTTAGASFVNADNGWQLANAVVATLGIARPLWIAPMSNQVLGTANLWSINATGSRYAIQTAFDGGPAVQPTGYRLASVAGTYFVPGSYLRSMVVQ